MFFHVLACADLADTSNPEDSGTEVEIPGQTLMGSVERNTSPSTADLPTLAAENTAFSLELLAALDPRENLVSSPWSLQVVMAQVYNGADGDAKTAIADAFGWSLEGERFAEAWDAAILAMEAHHDPSGEYPLSFTSTNQIFVTDGYELGADWLDLLSEFYGTGAQQLDFEADPAGVADDINAWISARTGGHIEELISASMVSNSRMLLVNAVWFAASWDIPFSESSTADADFSLLDGSTVSVPTMSGSVNLRGADGDGFFLVEIPYTDDELVMSVILPDPGAYEAVLGLDPADFIAAAEAVEYCKECPISLPKFRIESTPAIQDALVTLGMGDAFGGAYPGIHPDLSLTGVDQMGFVEVNEIGTEAAAATVAEFSDSASEPPFGPVVVDRPFLWMVREKASGAVLFAGAVVDPR